MATLFQNPLDIYFYFYLILFSKESFSYECWLSIDIFSSVNEAIYFFFCAVCLPAGTFSTQPGACGSIENIQDKISQSL